MAKLTNVEFYGTGGGCVRFSALVNDEAWLATDFECAFYYDENVELVDDDFLNGVDYEEHLKTPSDPLPTWGEIFDAISQYCDPSHVEWAKLIMKRFDLSAVCTQGWEYTSDEYEV